MELVCPGIYVQRVDMSRVGGGQTFDKMRYGRPVGVTHHVGMLSFFSCRVVILGRSCSVKDLFFKALSILFSYLSAYESISHNLL